jgi:hypothetical protein
MNRILTELSGVELRWAFSLKPDFYRWRLRYWVPSFTCCWRAFTEIGMAVIFKRRLEFVIDPQQNSLELSWGHQIVYRWGYNRFITSKSVRKVWVLWGMKIQRDWICTPVCYSARGEPRHILSRYLRHPVRLIKAIRYKIPIELKEL